MWLLLRWRGGGARACRRGTRDKARGVARREAEEYLVVIHQRGGGAMIPAAVEWGGEGLIWVGRFVATTWFGSTSLRAGGSPCGTGVAVVVRLSSRQF
jgi:hypothetical protein